MRTHRYRIIVAGGLSEIGREAFSDFRIEANGTNTALIRDLDQAALYGTLNRILSLGFELIELRRLTEQRELGGACVISTSSRPSARTRSSTACRPRWSRFPDKTVMAGSTSTTRSANASYVAGPNEPMTLISYMCLVTETSFLDPIRGPGEPPPDRGRAT